MDFQFDVPAMMSHVMDWLDIIGPTGHTLIDLTLGALVGGLSLILLASYMFRQERGE